MNFKYVILLYSSSVIGNLLTIVCMLGLYYFMLRDLQRHQPHKFGLTSSSSCSGYVNSSSCDDTSNVDPQFLLCNPSHQSTPIPALRSRLAGVTISLNSLGEVVSLRLPDF